jgi:hypothetical protein
VSLRNEGWRRRRTKKVGFIINITSIGTVKRVERKQLSIREREM